MVHDHVIAPNFCSIILIPRMKPHERKKTCTTTCVEQHLYKKCTGVVYNTSVVVHNTSVVK